MNELNFGEVPHDRGKWKRKSQPMNWAYKTMDFDHLYDVPPGKELMSDEEFKTFLEKRNGRERNN